MKPLIENEEAARNRNYGVAQEFMHTSNMQQWFDMLHKEAVVEFPYAGSLHSPEKLEGKTAVVNYLTQMLAQIGHLKFEGVVTTPTTDPELFFNEYYADITTPAGKKYRQIYISKMRVKDGQVIFIKEFWDTKKIVDAIDFKINI
jgi:ketosteroid isomerase-like protein